MKAESSFSTLNYYEFILLLVKIEVTIQMIDPILNFCK